MSPPTKPGSDDGEKKKEKMQNSRGAKDDWEAIKLALEAFPSLKQRVMHKLKEMKTRKQSGPTKVSLKEQKDYQREMQRKEKSK